MSAVISPCGRYRYELGRRLAMQPGPIGTFVMVNPSTADAETDDATIRKLKGFASRWGWQGFRVVNLFAWRATDIRELALAPDPVGYRNDAFLFSAILGGDEVVFAWGPTGKLPKALRNRWRRAWGMAQGMGVKPKCIGAPAKDGHPRHPLMLAYSEELREWTPPVEASSGEVRP